jgi:transcription termination/antitermination protein NusA
MKNVNIGEAFTQLVKERGMEKDVLSQIIEETFLSMIRKKFGTSDNFGVFVNMDKGEIEIYQSKTVVESVEDPLMEVDLATALLAEESYEVGDEFLEIIDPLQFGRRLIIAAKQNLNQRIKDVEKEHVFDEFKNRIGEILSGDIRQINRDEIFINAENTEVVLPKYEQIPNERYRRGENLRAVIKDVRWSARGPEIVVSRSDPQFLSRLFEIEVPEIYDGIIEVKGIAREPGERTKIAVYSNDKRIDAVGACVGMKGMRIQAIVKELNNEKIDIINWSSEPEIFITRALSPAKPKRIAIDEEERNVIALLDDDQISLAIGKGGQNRRLAVKLTGYDIQTVKEEEYLQLTKDEDENIPLSDVDGLSEKLFNTLELGGFEYLEEVIEAGASQLTELPGVGAKTAEKIISLLEEIEAKSKDEEEEPEED